MTLQELIGQSLTEEELKNLGYNVQTNSTYDGLSGMNTVSGYQANSGSQDWADANGSYGMWTTGLTKNEDGTYTVGDNVGFNNQDKDSGYFANNLEWIGPLLVGGAAGLGAAYGGATVGAGANTTAGAGMGADGMAASTVAGQGAIGSQAAAPVVASTPTTVNGVAVGASDGLANAGMPPATMTPAGSDAAVLGMSSGSQVAGANGALGAAAGNAAANMANNAATPTLPTWLTDLGKNLGINGSDLLKLFSSGLGSYFNGQTADRLMDLYKPYNEQAGFYGNLLKTSYTDPGSYLQGPDVQAALRTTGDYLQRKDAAGGDLSNNFGRQVKLNDYIMGNLDNYRKGLQGTYQGLAGIGTGQGMYNATQASGNAMNPLLYTLSGIGQPTTTRTNSTATGA